MTRHSAEWADEGQAVPALPTSEWQALFGSVPPPRMPMLIEQAVAWKKQVLQHGNAPAPIRRDLDVALAGIRSARAKRSPSSLEQHALCTEMDNAADSFNAFCNNNGAGELPTASSQLLVGARLLKAYGGRSHIVEVTADGMLYEGKLFGSLSAVAKAITGTHWNGLLFFGLRKRRTYPAKLPANG